MKKIFFTTYALITNAALLSLAYIILVKQNTDFNAPEAMDQNQNVLTLCGLFIMCGVVAFLSTKKAIETFKK